jgi:FtsZ-interacting cell division protein ZipA
MDTTVLVIILIVALLAVIGVAAWMYTRRQKSHQLRDRFGPEYEQTVREQGSRARAEDALQERVNRVERLSIRPLNRERRDEFSHLWDQVQAAFVDDPQGATAEANRLVKDVMAERGYPVASFEQRAADISVDHPRVVSNYREAHAITVRSAQGDSTTDDLRRGFVYYRELFAELLDPDQANDTVVEDRPVRRSGRRAVQS